MKKRSLSAVVLMTIIALFIGNAQPFQGNMQSFARYKITEVRHDGLRAFVKYTGQQILIINNDAFDWINVQVAVRAIPILDHAVPEGLPAAEMAHSLPRMKARGVYTIRALQFGEGNGPAGGNLSMRPLSLEIRCDTPQGRSSWAGRWEEGS
jgi:hypothetical protein